MTNKYGIDKETLIRLYWINDPGWSQIDIAKYYGCCNSIIHNYMVKFNVPRRDLSTAMLNRFKCSWKKEIHNKGNRTPECRKRNRRKLKEWQAKYWTEEKRQEQSIRAKKQAKKTNRWC